MTATDLSAPRFLPQLACETVPRYTSYPPATGFRAETGAENWVSWMQDLPETPAVSLYLHVPFCKSMCWYCGCHTTIPNRRERIERYVEALLIELDQRAAQLPADHQVHHIHFGGGSPDMLNPAEMTRIMERLRARFTLAPDAEIAAELDPRGVTGELAANLADNGFNRVSLGVQDLSEEVQTLIHRIQPLTTVERAVATLRAAGIAAINLDIMYGLPAQTRERVARTARCAAMLKPDRIALFGYAHVPWFKKHQRAIPEDRLPGAQARFEQMFTATGVLELAGYQPVGFDHFARPDDALAVAARTGKLNRNFQGYTDDRYDVLIGLGASAISEAPGGYVQNETDPAVFAEALENGQSALVRGRGRSVEERRTGARIERVLCDFHLASGTIDDADRAALEDLLQLGLVEEQDGHLQVTAAGRPYVRNIAARLDPAFNAGTERHSVAV
ncbi:oxygen-independent coproporphyrinogen III oxidase [Maricaulis sp.]|uniref:oxygen-independent coproporphyrinogen III oxidase n=1 Tax=Maricaulis sp. TaxID=1486257 RepID=UPI002626A7DE|nr:oxygen-independent coproporphyrinogen III oxidase [Maricaulis sp.]